MTDLNITATSYAFLQRETTCWKCSASIPVTAIWVPGFLDNEDEEYPEEGGPSLLKYVSALDVGTMARVKATAPWLKPNYSQTASQTYLASHCQACDVAAGRPFRLQPRRPVLPQRPGWRESAESHPGGTGP
ncbi:hypothetical protein [Xanthomonas campestris]|uniref:hypothetical protein n=1 Tax=Xanthomonas campestris TaxID=339 RepID=UPI002B233750|nr:hypothetical protein [Xanthomonas campestris]MEA9705253.1 hypothetical protein [Xanthomonas campestris pv. raphani]